MSQEHCYITVKVGKSECSEADFSKYVESAFTRHDWGEHHIYYDGELREYIVRGVKLHAGSIFFELKSVCELLHLSCFMSFDWYLIRSPGTRISRLGGTVLATSLRTRRKT